LSLLNPEFHYGSSVIYKNISEYFPQFQMTQESNNSLSSSSLSGESIADGQKSALDQTAVIQPQLPSDRILSISQQLQHTLDGKLYHAGFAYKHNTLSLIGDVVAPGVIVGEMMDRLFHLITGAENGVNGG
jgi:hypothetical protein